MRFFNTAGPCNPIDHYMIPAAERFAAAEFDRLISQKAYFVVHAPRRTGKTTTMQALARQLTQEGIYTAALLSMEVGAAFTQDIGAAERAILGDWRYAIRAQLPIDQHPPTTLPPAPDGQQIGAFLAEWATQNTRPLVIFLDEIDALADNTLLSVLRQLRSGYTHRPQSFPSSLALIGLRDVRDYKIASGGSPSLRTPSPFNIAVRALTLNNFTPDEVTRLLAQHQNETGQSFTPEAQAYLYDLTQGQPWLVNALAKVAVEELEPSATITQPVIAFAKERLIQRRQTHLDQLADKLRDPRVQRVITPILAGTTLTAVDRDEIDYVIDLGLIRASNGSSLEIANPIYREVIPRELATVPQASLPALHPTWLNGDGSLNPDKLLAAFLAFWRQHGQPLLQSAPYPEIAPHLVLMAFLHRVVNGGGTIEREYAIGTGRMDLCLRYDQVMLAMELKLWRDGKPDPLSRGLTQLDQYLAGLGLETGWLIIFDRRFGLPDISQRTTVEKQVTPGGREITLIRA